MNTKAVTHVLPQAFAKLNPLHLRRSPVILVAWFAAVITTVLAIMDPFWFSVWVAIWLWATILFANVAEALAEGRGKAQAASLRASRQDTTARRLDGEREEQISAADLRLGDLVKCQAGDVIPGDGDIVEGAATVDESAITGESAPVIREAGGDRCAVTGGTTVLSDTIIVRITSKPGDTVIDRMIALVEGANRQRTPNEIALGIVLMVLTVIFMFVTAVLPVVAHYLGARIDVVTLMALLVCLIPTTIGGLLSAIGIAGMDQLVRQNVLAMSGRAVEAAGDVSTLLLDKTGTITFGNRQASEFRPLASVKNEELVQASYLASLADETPEGRSIVDLAEVPSGFPTSAVELARSGATVISFSAQTRMSGVDFPDGRKIRKGAGGAISAWVAAGRLAQESDERDEARQVANQIAQLGGTPLSVAVEEAGVRRMLGIIYLKDVVKPGMPEKFAKLRKMGIRTVMITGDNPLTARAIALEAGVDDFLAEATPEDKLALIKQEQAGGRMVAMTGDGTNDAPALAQADVGVAMNTGTSAAKEAGNMVDLDSDPSKLIQIVTIGKQLLMTRGALTTFSIANDIAKYFAIIPAMFMGIFPGLSALNIMGLSSGSSAILSAVIFNALIIVALIPLALRGVPYKPQSAKRLLTRNILIYGVGGVIAPFVGIKLIDLFVSALI